MMRAGLEWLFRLVREPRRLWKRYLVYNTRFAACQLRGCTGFSFVIATVLLWSPVLIISGVLVIA